MREINFSVETQFGLYSDTIFCQDDATDVEIEQLKSDRINAYINLITVMSETT